jgi:uncharacterized protein (DUF885 family)
MVSMRSAFAGVIALLLLNSCAPTTGSEDQRLSRLIAAHTQREERFDAFLAPYYGVEENLDKFGDYLSPQYFTRAKAMYRDALDNLQSIDVGRLSEEEQLEYRLFRDDMTVSLGAYDFPLELLDFNQMTSRLHEFIDESSPALSYFPFDSVVHYKAWLKRAEDFPAYVDRQIETLSRGVRSDIVLNCTIARSVIKTYEDALEPEVEKNPFYRPLSVMPAGFTPAQRAELTAAFSSTIATRIVPAFVKFDRFYKEGYLPHCRTTYGIGALPNGAAMYAYYVRANTDVDWSAEKIHALGLEEVRRITTELSAVKDEMGFKGSLTEFRRSLVEGDANFFRTGAELFSAFKTYQAEVDAAVPRLFNLRPKTPLRLEEAENPEYASASYDAPTDGHPVGRFIVNTKNLKGVPVYDVKTVYLHEAVPGHHYQLAIQFELKGKLSEYRRKLYESTAFAEGWALYAERLGREEGLVPEPLQRIGSLSDEMLRAVRLVVDTGIHHYGWSREQAIAYMTENLTAVAREIEIEADRYSVWPGQALSYKIGQIRILELREKARKALGKDFDIREFHDVVIGHGMVSLGVLETMVDAYIAKKQRKGP